MLLLSALRHLTCYVHVTWTWIFDCSALHVTNEVSAGDCEGDEVSVSGTSDAMIHEMVVDAGGLGVIWPSGLVQALVYSGDTLEVFPWHSKRSVTF